MAPLISSYLPSLLRRTSSPSADPTSSTVDLSSLARAIVPRSTVNPVSSVGVTPPDSIPNKFVFVVFGLIGAGFVITGIWFFFWAKNGGFHFRKDDWDDYKTTVLRRRGPNGTLLSGASESTDLGGGSIVHGEKSSKWGRSRKGGKKSRKTTDERYKDFDDEESQVTSSLGTSTVGTESEISAFKKKMRRGRKDKKKDKSAMSEVGTVDEHADMDASVADAIREYRHEQPARVGGINKQPDGSSWDGSNEAASELLSHREHTPTNTPIKVRKERKDNYTGGTGNGGIRKVVSVSQPSGDIGVRTRESTHSPATHSITEDRIKAEARKLQEKGRAATSSSGAGTSRRDFSFQVGDDHSTVSGGGSSSAASEATARRERREERERRRQSRSPTKKMPGTYMEVPASEVGTDASSDLGTKSYHHPIPGLSSTVGSEYAEERRRKRNGGYRRGRTDSDGE
jgi:hypothetical protein